MFMAKKKIKICLQKHSNPKDTKVVDLEKTFKFINDLGWRDYQYKSCRS